MDTVHIEDGAGLAVRKHALPLLRKLGVKDIAEYEPHRLDWRELGAHGKEIVKSCRALLDSLRDDTPEAEARSIETAHEALVTVLDAIEGEKNVRGELGNRGPRKHGGSPKRPMGATGSVRGDGMPMEADEPVFALAPEQRMAEWLEDRNRGVPSEYASLSTGRYLRSLVLGAKSDLEKRALSEGTDSAGGYSVPDILSARMIDAVRAAMVTMGAGAQTVPLGSDTNYISRVDSDPSPGWRNENAAIAESDPTFGRVTLAPKSLAVLVKVSRELLEDSLNMEAQLPRIMVQALAHELDRVALNGSGSAPEPTGVINTSGIGEVAVGGALSNYAKLVTARRDLLNANHAGPFAVIMSPYEDATLAGLSDSTGQPLQAPKAIDQAPKFVTTSMPGDPTASPAVSGTMLMGDFRRLLIGIRNEIRVEVLRERFADVHQYGFIAQLRADVAVEHATAFVKLTGITA